MSDIKLFKLYNQSVQEIEGKSVAVEKSLQTLIENNLETFLGVTFLASEYSTGKKHGGRIDTLGIDENNCPVIIEYKRSTNENVINQGLYYLDWLLDHKAEFQLLVLNKISNKVADAIEWASARLICIAGDYIKYDGYAVEQINRNIELIRYKKYEDLLLLELVNVVSEQEVASEGSKQVKYPTVLELLAKAKEELKDLYEAIKAYLLNLGDDVQVKELKLYIAFKRIKNFACLEIHPQSNEITVFVRLDPTSVQLEKGFSRDVRNIGHWGTGDLEIKIKTMDDFEKAKPLLVKSYEVN